MLFSAVQLIKVYKLSAEEETLITPSASEGPGQDIPMLKAQQAIPTGFYFHSEIPLPSLEQFYLLASVVCLVHTILLLRENS